jgi:hypothetical protein
MDASGASIVVSAIGNGIALGLATVTAITITLLPASYVMNRFSYHTPLMRIIMGIMAAVGSFATFAIVMIGCATGSFRKPHYFGLLPTLLDMGGPETAKTGWFAWAKQLVTLIAHPFKLFYNEEGYVANIESLLVPKKDGPTAPIANPLVEGGPDKIYKGAVYEQFFKAARAAGAIENHGKWVARMTELEDSGIGAAMFSSDADV